jgi:hypothetical protein
MRRAAREAPAGCVGVCVCVWGGGGSGKGIRGRLATEQEWEGQEDGGMGLCVTRSA